MMPSGQAAAKGNPRAEGTLWDVRFPRVVLAAMVRVKISANEEVPVGERQPGLLDPLIT